MLPAQFKDGNGVLVYNCQAGIPVSENYLIRAYRYGRDGWLELAGIITLSPKLETSGNENFPGT